MKKLLFIFPIILLSCSPEYVEVPNFNNDSIFMDSISEDDYSILETPNDCSDSIIERTKRLIKSTENSHKKVKHLEQIAQENEELNIENENLQEEMMYVKKERDELVDEINKERARKGVIQRVIEAIKDTTR